MGEWRKHSKSFSGGCLCRYVNSVKNHPDQTVHIQCRHFKYDIVNRKFVQTRSVSLKLRIGTCVLQKGSMCGGPLSRPGGSSLKYSVMSGKKTSAPEAFSRCKLSRTKLAKREIMTFSPKEEISN